MAILIVIGMLAMCIGIRFAFVQKAARKRFAAYENKAKKLITSLGEISYIDEGKGEAIISCHGICGGYDQAYDTLAGKENRYRILAPSRFGYPGSSMPKEPSIEKQAQAFVQLLDALNIDKTYILATSAGGAVAIKFALRYPQRLKGLILYCSSYPELERPKKKATYVGPPSFLCHDLIMWLFSPLFDLTMGMKPSTVKMIMPFKEKHEGIVFDAKVSNTEMLNWFQDYDMSQLQVPTLIFHAKDDKMANFTMAQSWSKKMPNCTFVAFETGGHLMEGNDEKIEEMLEQFITANK